MSLDEVFSPELIREFEDRVAAKVLEHLSQHPMDAIVPRQATFTLGEAYQLRGVSASTVTNKPWLRIDIVPGDRLLRSEVVAYLNKSDAQLRAEYELRIQSLGASS